MKTGLNKKKKKLIISVVAVIVIISTFYSGTGILKNIPSMYSYFDQKSLTAVTNAAAVNNADDVRLVAHRGLSSVAPENTAEAIKKACDYGFYGAEFDIYATTDGEWVLMHNDNIKDMTNGSGKVIDFSLEEIKQFIIDSGNNCKRYDSIKIPTLDEVLQVFADSQTVPVIEIKDNRLLYLDKISQSLIKYGLADKAVIISFSTDVLKAVKEQFPSLECWLLVNSFKTEDIGSYISMGFDGIDFNGSEQLKTDKNAVTQAKLAGMETAAWTVDSINELNELYTVGVTVITTNSIIPQ